MLSLIEQRTNFRRNAVGDSLHRRLHGLVVLSHNGNQWFSLILPKGVTEGVKLSVVVAVPQGKLTSQSGARSLWPLGAVPSPTSE